MGLEMKPMPALLVAAVFVAACGDSVGSDVELASVSSAELARAAGEDADVVTIGGDRARTGWNPSEDRLTPRAIAERGLAEL